MFKLRRFLAMFPVERWRNPPPVVPVLRLAGAIGVGPFGGLTLSQLAPAIERVFGRDDAAAVAIVVNSPGGSPVQSALIAGRIRALAEEKKLTVFAFTEDAAASGGYWLATAADQIYADPSSIIGSIGVISSGFGFPDFIHRLGIERRVHTSGTRKGMLDPFRPEQEEDVARLGTIMGDMHETFRSQVRSRRGDRLKADDETLFSGEFWTGRRALDLGLIDGLGDIRSVMRARFGEKVRLVPVAIDRRWWRRRSVVGEALAMIEDRLAWARIGL